MSEITQPQLPPIPVELEQAALSWGVSGLSDEVIVERTTQALENMYSWHGRDGVGGLETEALPNDDINGLRKAVIKNILSLMIEGKCFQGNESQITPLDSDDEACISELLRRSVLRTPGGSDG